MEEKILAIIEKIRNMYRYDPNCRDLVQNDPSISLKLIKGKLSIDCISWQWYSSIYATEERITFHPEYGNARTLVEYNGWDALLKL